MFCGRPGSQSRRAMVGFDEADGFLPPSPCGATQKKVSIEDAVDAIPE
jgi:hypothetical protein